MLEKAVIDRFEEGWAVLLVGEEERRIDVPRKDLPRGVREGHWLRVALCCDQIVDAEIDEQETRRVSERISNKLDRLRRGDHLR
jgi:hypothetical protein